MDRQAQGQALVEGMMLLTLLVLLVTLVQQTLTPLLSKQQQRIDSSRQQLWAWADNKALQYSDDYAFAEHADGILAPMQTLSGLRLEQDNLRVLAGSDSSLPMARLTDNWSAASLAELSSQPALLTPASRLNQYGFATLQGWLSWFHFTEEFAPDQLRVGYVNADVTPQELHCKTERRCSP
ncbi:hypothetical protein [Pseudidiomarina insulisalsae]|uniref:Uncharacterized protein n=1 Tax=Pseudidiomarina insulisalsae TaxID=575789 RepID=A0A432Y8N4_9GAMM|nr:hypothetical protein [Pseudidiomarina insulisalsae]RUO57334.1 hypothetical protein CWI71_11815 [Pseudidiomarina insulisalsae]